MIEGLGDSDRAYNDRIVGEKTKQKNAQLCFAQKTLRLTKTRRGIIPNGTLLPVRFHEKKSRASYKAPQ